MFLSPLLKYLHFENQAAINLNDNKFGSRGYENLTKKQPDLARQKDT